tara:strand:+ start:9504 stop:9959 length:456 start_codon:yes stop_codon:yes gene_type:complete
MPKKNEREIVRQMRRYKALDMKMAGGTERSIAKALGVSNVQIHKDIRKVLGELADSFSPQADELRTLTMARYERLLLAHWPNALNGDPKATELCLSIINGQRAISGLDAPTQITGADGGPVRISIDELAKIAHDNGYNTELGGANSLPEAT